PEYDEVSNPRKTLTTTEAAKRLGISGGTVHRLIDEGILAATQALPGAPWEISPESVESRIASGSTARSRDRNQQRFRDTKTIELPFPEGEGA
ncbi:MAG: helix-turn-helix domain-containing protein, partial [Dechloromonas sp.]|nr:helix-turn-helix domain-containing protein [Dechloromonas sp.]